MKRITEKIAENDMWIDGKYMSEIDMQNDGMAEYLGNEFNNRHSLFIIHFPLYL